MPTYLETLQSTERALLDAGVHCGHGYESAHDEAVALTLAAAGLPESTGTEILGELVPTEALQRLAGYVSTRVNARQPVAYITGYGWLGHLRFKSDARALVPRSPLMALVQDDYAPWWSHEAPDVIVDVCCGGGSLGLLAADLSPDSRVVLTDIDERALSLARENCELHQAANVICMCADLLTGLGSQMADIIIANPPYVDAEDMASLPPEFLHEPRHALAAGDDGMDLVHALLEQAARVLTPRGMLFLEVGNSWVHLEAAYPQHPFLWLELASGGHGVCVLTRDELAALCASRRASS